MQRIASAFLAIKCHINNLSSVMNQGKVFSIMQCNRSVYTITNKLNIMYGYCDRNYSIVKVTNIAQVRRIYLLQSMAGKKLIRP